MLVVLIYSGIHFIRFQFSSILSNMCHTDAHFKLSSILIDVPGALLAQSILFENLSLSFHPSICAHTHINFYLDIEQYIQALSAAIKIYRNVMNVNVLSIKWLYRQWTFFNVCNSWNVHKSLDFIIKRKQNGGKNNKLRLHNGISFYKEIATFALQFGWYFFLSVSLLKNYAHAKKNNNRLLYDSRSLIYINVQINCISWFKKEYSERKTERSGVRIQTGCTHIYVNTWCV